ncbi:AraC-like DNA-binding protein [Dyadobacter jejuensis]|uniref:AraC-like DNA-binding protein n=1 Tax=Dyadobacter jejuensis TaxID=1082580 RepID=A0A316AA33_9BACT|nr:AraC family transcriptional regulator [Dyadobacter jejuensis]PWJ54776.1 AraC-like DNA-binding protein [Dyadobacter jejuensis]
MKVIPFTIPVVQNCTLVVQRQKLHYYYPHLHRHQEVQLEYVLKGSGILIAGNYMQRFQAGDIYLIGANQAHMFKSDEGHFVAGLAPEVDSLSVFFKIEALQHTLLALPEMEEVRRLLLNSHNGYQVPEENASVVQHTMLQLSQESENLRIGTFIRLLQQLSRLGPKPLASFSSVDTLSEAEGSRMDKIFQFMVGNHHRHIALSEIAEVANFTPQAFCRYFKKHTDKTFVSFLNEIRVKEACKLIVSGRHEGYADIAFRVGFENVTNFNRVFKKVVGQAPGIYFHQFQASHRTQ